MAKKDNIIENIPVKEEQVTPANEQAQELSEMLKKQEKEMEEIRKANEEARKRSNESAKKLFKGIGRFFQKIFEIPFEAVAFVIATFKTALFYNPKVNDQSKDLKDRVTVDSSYNTNRSQVIRDKSEVKERKEEKDQRIAKSPLTKRYNKFIDTYEGKVPNSTAFSYMKHLRDAGERMLPDEISKFINYGLGKDFTVISDTKGEYQIQHKDGGIITLDDKLKLIREKTNADKRVVEFVVNNTKGLEGLDVLGKDNKLNKESMALLKTLNITPYEVHQNDLGYSVKGEMHLDYKSVRKYLMERDGKLEKSVHLLLQADMSKNKVPNKEERLAKATAEFTKEVNAINEQRIYESEPTTTFDNYMKEYNGKVEVDKYLEALKKKKVSITPKDFSAFMHHKYGDKVSIEFQPKNNCYSVFDLSNATKNAEGEYVNAGKFKVNLDGAIRESDMAKINQDKGLGELSKEISEMIRSNKGMVDYSTIKPTFASKVNDMMNRFMGTTNEEKRNKGLKSVEKVLNTVLKSEKKTEPEVRWVQPEMAEKPAERRSPEYEKKQPEQEISEKKENKYEYKDTDVFHSDLGDDILGDDEEARTSSKEEDKNFDIGDAVLDGKGVDWDKLFEDDDFGTNNNPSRDDDFDR